MCTHKDTHGYKPDCSMKYWPASREIGLIRGMRPASQPSFSNSRHRGGLSPNYAKTNHRQKGCKRSLSRKYHTSPESLVCPCAPAGMGMAPASEASRTTPEVCLFVRNCSYNGPSVVML